MTPPPARPDHIAREGVKEPLGRAPLAYRQADFETFEERMRHALDWWE